MKALYFLIAVALISSILVAYQGLSYRRDACLQTHSEKALTQAEQADTQKSEDDCGHWPNYFWEDFYANVSTEMFFIVITLGVINNIVERLQREERIASLERDVRSRVPYVGTRAIDELRQIDDDDAGKPFSRLYSWFKHSDNEKPSANSELQKVLVRINRQQRTKLDLSDVNLDGVKFTGATHIFIETKLQSSSFRQATLCGAVFLKAILTGADLTGADLTGADLQGAILVGATLDNAILDNAKNLTASQLRAAKSITGATMVNGEVLGAGGLEEWLVRHRAAGVANFTFDDPRPTTGGFLSNPSKSINPDIAPIREFLLTLRLPRFGKLRIVLHEVLVRIVGDRLP